MSNDMQVSEQSSSDFQKGVIAFIQGSIALLFFMMLR